MHQTRFSKPSEPMGYARGSEALTQTICREARMTKRICRLQAETLYCEWEVCGSGSISRDVERFAVAQN